MSLTDPIADMITMIKNASKAGKETVDVKASKICEGILKIFKEKKFISNYRKIESGPQGLLRVYLRFLGKKIPAITDIKRVSKSGLRRYVKKDEIPRVLEGIGLAIISTSQGLITDQQAREKGLGGEVILYAW